MSTVSINQPSPQPSQIGLSQPSSQLISAYIRLNSKKAYLVQIPSKITLTQLYHLVARHLNLASDQLLIITKGRILPHGVIPLNSTNSVIVRKQSSLNANSSAQNKQKLTENAEQVNGVSFPFVQLVVEDRQIFHAILYQNVSQPKTFRLMIKQLIKLEQNIPNHSNGIISNESNNLSNNESGNLLNLNVKDLSGSLYNNSSYRTNLSFKTNSIRPLCHIHEIEGVNKGQPIRDFINESLSQMPVPLTNSEAILSHLSGIDKDQSGIDKGELIELPASIQFGLLRSIMRDEAVLVYTGRILASENSLEEEYVEDNAQVVVTFRKPLRIKSLVHFYRLMKEKSSKQLIDPHVIDQEQNSWQSGRAKVEQRSVKTEQEEKFTKNQSQESPVTVQAVKDEPVLVQAAKQQQTEINITFSPHKVSVNNEQGQPLQVVFHSANHQIIAQTSSQVNKESRQAYHQGQEQIGSGRRLGLDDGQQNVGKVQVFTQQEHYAYHDGQLESVQLQNSNNTETNSEQMASPYFLQSAKHKLQQFIQEEQANNQVQVQDQMQVQEDGRNSYQKYEHTQKFIEGEVESAEQHPTQRFQQSPIHMRKVSQQINCSVDTLIDNLADSTPIDKLQDSPVNNTYSPTDQYLDSPTDQHLESPIDQHLDSPTDQYISTPIDELIDTPIDRLQESFSDKPALLNTSHDHTLVNDSTNRLPYEQVSINYMSPQALEAFSKTQLSEGNLLPSNTSLNLQPINEESLGHFSQELVQQEKKLSLENALHHETHHNTDHMLQYITQLQQTQENYKIQLSNQVQPIHQQQPEQQQQQIDQLQSSKPHNDQQDLSQTHLKSVQNLLAQKQHQYQSLKAANQLKCSQMLSSYTRLIDGLTGELLPESQLQYQQYLNFKHQTDNLLPPNETQILNHYHLQSSIPSDLQENGSSLKQQTLEFSTELNHKLNTSRPQSLPATPADPVQLQVPKSGSQQTIPFGQESFVVSSIEMNGDLEHKREIEGRKIHEYVESYNGNLLDISPIHEHPLEENPQHNQFHSENKQHLNQLNEQNHDELNGNEEKYQATENHRENQFIQNLESGHEIYIVEGQQDNPQSRDIQIYIQETPITLQSAKNQEQLYAIQTHLKEKQNSQTQRQENLQVHLQQNFEVKVNLIPSDGESDNLVKGDALIASSLLSDQQIYGSASTKNRYSFYYEPPEEQKINFDIQLKKQLDLKQLQPDVIENFVNDVHNIEQDLDLSQSIEKLEGTPHQQQIGTPHEEQIDPLEQALAIVQKPESFIDDNHSIDEPLQELQNFSIEDKPQSILESKPNELVQADIKPVVLQTTPQQLRQNQHLHLPENQPITQLNSQNQDLLDDMHSNHSDHSNPWTQQQNEDHSNDVSQHQPKVKFTQGDLLYTIELDLNPKPKLIDAIAYEYHDLLCKNLQEFVQIFGNIIPEDDPNLFHQPFSSDDQKLKTMMGL